MTAPDGPQPQPGPEPVPGVVVVHDGRDVGARRYAEWTAEEIGTTATTWAEVDPMTLVVASKVVLFCGITPDGLPGAAPAIEVREALQGSGRQVAVAIVGLDPVHSPARMEFLMEALPQEVLGEVKIFQLRGAVDESELGTVDKLKLRAQAAALVAREPHSLDHRAVAANDGILDFTRRSALGPLLRWVRGTG